MPDDLPDYNIAPVFGAWATVSSAIVLFGRQRARNAFATEARASS
jgi:hypothetical protein